MANKYGNLIAYYRKLSGLKQSELASKLNVTDRAISSWETGRTEPNMDTVSKLADIFGCKISDLMGSESKTSESIINEYMNDKNIQRLIIYAGLNIPSEKREKYVDALIKTIETLNSLTS